ncbi:MAG TPA: type II CAAX endopeptidase family protein [Thermoanaerobaculia bacterium]|nr:type II CAAX endopeptidase family protein [Thermoanaerobaculia bacterium]
MSQTPGRELVKFFVLSYAVTWVFFVTVATVIPASTPLGALLVLLGAFAPSMAALWLTARDEGSDGVRALLGRVLRWRVAPRWYLFAVSYIAVIKLTVALLHRVTTGVWPRFGTDPWYLIPLAIAFSTPFQAGEEIGWRGYALPRLAERFGLARASLLLGVIWACWHLPQFYIAGADTNGQSFFVFLFEVVPMSVAMAWLYARTNGSLLLVMLLHAAVNNSKDIVPSATPGATNPFTLNASPVAWLTVAILWVCAAYFLVRMPQWPPGTSVIRPSA